MIAFILASNTVSIMHRQHHPDKNLTLHRFLGLPGLLLGGLLLLSACEERPSYEGIEADTTAVVDPGAVVAPPPLEERANTIDVILTEYTIEMSDSVASGATIFRVINNGSMEHSFEIEGPNQGVQARNLHPGEIDSVRVTLNTGRYQVYCPVADHTERGMTRTLQVIGITS
jgi:hypothetical protein